jgi:hypothetical protein
MRTSITLDDETHDFASVYAQARGITLGAALGELVRKARTAPNSAVSSIKTLPGGLPVFRSRGRKLTPEMVREAQEDDAQG